MDPDEIARMLADRDRSIASHRDIGKELGAMWIGLEENGIPPFFAAITVGTYQAQLFLGMWRDDNPEDA